MAHAGTRNSYLSAFFIVTLIAITPALGVIIYTGVEQATKLEADARAAAMRRVVAFSSIQERITNSTRQILASIAALPAIRHNDLEHLQEVLKAVQESNPEHLTFSLVDREGKVIVSAALQKGMDLSDRLHVRTAITENRFAAGEYVLAKLNAEPTFPFAYPVRDTAGKAIGAVLTVFRLSSYGPLFEEFALPKDSFIGIIDRKGVRVYHYPPKETNPLGGFVKDSVWAKLHKGGDEGIFVDIASDGIERYFAFKALNLEGGDHYLYIVYATPTSEARNAALSILLRNVLIMLGAICFALLASTILARALVGKRLERILQTVSSIEEGRYEARTGLSSDISDLGHIASALDKMAATVEKREAERVEQARAIEESLDEKEILLKEIHHRVKNNLQVILSLIRLQRDAAVDSGAPIGSIEMSLDMENRVSSMAVLHEMLYERETKGHVILSEYLARITDLLARSRRNDDSVAISLAVDPVEVDLERAVPIGLLVNELASNSYKHAFKNGARGRIDIIAHSMGNTLLLEARDSGPGLPEGFSLDSSKGIGLKLSVALASQLGGELKWANEGGARFWVEFPLNQENS